MTASDSSFTVAFGKTGRTLDYHAGQDTITFTFDVGGGDRTLSLEHWPQHEARPPHYDQAFARTKQFLESCGYKVEEDGVARPPAPLGESKVAEIVRAQTPQPLPSTVGLVVPPVRQQFRDDTSASYWNLWLAAELIAGPHLGHKIVFDDQTRQFGVASTADVFLGFWGSFRQTLDALLTR